MKNKLLKFIDKLNCSRSIVMSDQTVTFCYTFPVKEYPQGLSDTLEFFLDLLTPVHTFVNSISEYNESGDLFLTITYDMDLLTNVIEKLGNDYDLSCRMKQDENGSFIMLTQNQNPENVFTEWELDSFVKELNSMLRDDVFTLKKVGYTSTTNFSFIVSTLEIVV